MKSIGNFRLCGACWLSLAIAVSLLPVAYASTFNVPSGTTDTQTGLTETDRTYKKGDGTLIVNGTSTFKTMTVEAGTMKFSGGTATIADSTATGAYSDAMFVQSGGNTIIADGAVVTASGGNYIDVNNGTFTVTNATFDASGIKSHMMNAFDKNNSDCWINIETNGVLKTTILRPTGIATAAMQDRVGIRLNRGGDLYLKNFFVDDVGNNRYGRIYFNGGYLHRTVADSATNGNLFIGDTTRTGWVKKQAVPTILEGGFYLYTSGESAINVGFESGAEHDGGAHFMSGNVIRWYGDNSYNGGTWLEATSGGILDVCRGDKSLGAIPAQPTTNIWVTGKDHTLYIESGNVTIHSNRTVFVKDGKPFKTGSKGRLFINGMIKGEASPGLDYPTNTYIEARANWSGTVIIGPGDGRTNDVGRIIVGSCLEVTSGVTRASSQFAAKTGSSALIYVEGNGSSYNDKRGHLVVSGGELYSPQSRYVDVSKYAQVDVVGGKVNTPEAEWLIGLTGAAKLSVSNGGEFVTKQLRVGQSSSFPTTINLGKGGLICPTLLRIETGNNQNATFNFDGGRLQSRTGSSGFIESSSNAKWAGVTFQVLEGGAVFDTSNGQHIHWKDRPIVSGAEHDGGLKVTGDSTHDLVVYSPAQFSYNGPTVADGAKLQLRGNDILPQTTLVLTNNGIAAFSLYDGDWQTRTHTTQTLPRVEGNGTVSYSKNVHVTNSIAPSVNGKIELEWACDLRGDYEICGNADGCSMINNQRDTLDISNLTLKVADFSTFDASKAKFNASTGTGYYQILKVNSGASYTGTFNLPADWPKDWKVEYTSNGAYLHCLKGTLVILR